MKKFLATLFTITMMIIAGCGGGNDEALSNDAPKEKSKLVIYTSVKNPLISMLIDSFIVYHPNVEIDCKIDGAGALMNAIVNEQRSDGIKADIIWTGEVDDFFKMKNDQLLYKYTPDDFPKSLNPFDDYDGSYTAARLVTLPLVVNTDIVTDLPTKWIDLVERSEYMNSVGFADPTVSGTSYMGIMMLDKALGDEYLMRLYKNGVLISNSSQQVLDDVANGKIAACLGVDYLALEKIEQGAHIALCYPHELLVVPSPIAIFNTSKNIDNAKEFVDFIFSQEAQKIIADSGSVPVRPDVVIPAKYNLPSTEEAIARKIRLNYDEVLAQKEFFIDTFKTLYNRTE